jgi:hypothetical protein
MLWNSPCPAKLRVVSAMAASSGRARRAHEPHMTERPRNIWNRTADVPFARSAASRPGRPHRGGSVNRLRAPLRAFAPSPAHP